MDDVGAQWDARFSGEGFAYGTEPNDWLREAAARFLPPGPLDVLSLGEGEGRNGAYLASLGHRVTALDASRVGLDKAVKLAAGRGLSVKPWHADLAGVDLPASAYDAVVSIFCHLPPPVRERAHAQAVAALRPGGLWLLEAYTPRQLQFRTGGPPVEALLYTEALLRADAAGLEVLHLQETERDIHEGALHHGRSAVVRLAARKPR